MSVKLLVVEDHPVFRDGLLLALQRMPTKPLVYAASSVSECEEFVLHVSDIDLAIIDLKLPDGSGLDIMRSFSHRNEIIPTVAISGETNLRDVKQALSYNALGFIPKTCDPETLRQAIQTVLDGDIWVPDDVQIMLAAGGDMKLPEAAIRLGITPKQFSVLELIAEGLANREIAAALNLTEHTVKSHSQALFNAFGVHNRTACVAAAQALDLIDVRSLAQHTLHRGP